MPAQSENATQTNTIISLPGTWTATPILSQTLKPSATQIFTKTPFVVKITFPPTWTLTATNEPIVIPTDEPIVVMDTPIENTATPTDPPQKANTSTPRPEITYTCGVSPSTIAGGTNTNLTFWVQFSSDSAGLGFSGVNFDQQFSGGPKGCAAGSNDQGYASCTGRSGLLPYRRTITATFSTSAGTCTATFKTQ